jgi:hypothetical protein
MIYLIVSSILLNVVPNFQAIFQIQQLNNIVGCVRQKVVTYQISRNGTLSYGFSWMPQGWLYAPYDSLHH